MPFQLRNNEAVALLSPDFQKRTEPNFAWQNIVSMMQMAPGKRGVWLMSGFDGTGQCLDISGNGLTLGMAGGVDYDYLGLVPFVDLDGTSDYLAKGSHAAFDITATEGYVQTSRQGVAVTDRQGLTLVAWVHSDVGNIGAAVVSKWEDNSNNRSYLLNVGVAGDYNFNISSLGTAATTVTVATGVALTQDTWTFLCGTFRPGSSIDLWVNDTRYTQATALAAIFASTVNFYVGRRDTGAATVDWDGYISIVGLYAMQWSEPLIKAFYNHSRHLYGV